MAQEMAVGVFLAVDAERDLLHAAAMACGLRSVDLQHSEYAPSIARLLPLIVTDQPTGPWEPAHGGCFSPYDAATLLQVCDPDPPAVPSAIVNPAPAWVMHRPLQLESATAALQQASSMTQVFLQRHRSMIDDLDHYRRVLDCVTDSISIADAHLPDLPLTYVNPAFERMTGYTASEVCGRNCRFLQGTDTDQPALAEIRAALRGGKAARVVLRNYRKDGTLFWNELHLYPIRDHAGNLAHFVGIQNDVTAQIAAKNQPQPPAHHDPLTGLANRGLLLAQLDLALEQARRNRTTVAVLCFDLDNFKDVNDTFGHDAGDQLLLVTADRLRSVARGGETVARLGGDEFVVVLQDINATREPARILHRLSAKLREPTTLLGTGIQPSASVGMAIFPRDGETPEELLKTAGVKMRLAKHTARANPQPPQPPPQQQRPISRLRDFFLRARL
ncbi:MAG TPA: diguanylate cyclase [Acidobacteriaceae bacterium]|nr:diguanylate cyclase [Acidobacteriaceae bacterium]